MDLAEKGSLKRAPRMDAQPTVNRGYYHCLQGESWEPLLSFCRLIPYRRGSTSAHFKRHITANNLLPRNQDLSCKPEIPGKFLISLILYLLLNKYVVSYLLPFCHLIRKRRKCGKKIKNYNQPRQWYCTSMYFPVPGHGSSSKTSLLTSTVQNRRPLHLRPQREKEKNSPWNLLVLSGFYFSVEWYSNKSRVYIWKSIRVSSRSFVHFGLIIIILKPRETFVPRDLEYCKNDK